MASQKKTYVTFKIASELYGIDIMEVREVIRLTDITPIPNSPNFVDGVVNIRSEIIPIIDMGKRFNFEKKEYTEDEELLRAIIIVRVEGLVIGIMIDEVFRVLSVYEKAIQPPPQMISGIGAEYIQGVTKLEDDTLFVILNVKKLFNKNELLQLSGDV